MNQYSRIRELEILKEISETINKAYEMEPMFNEVLAKLLELTGLQTGWVFLADSSRGNVYQCAADRQLPPALLIDDKRPMREGRCWCMDRFWDGRLNQAVNILSCKRLEDAVRYRWGDTQGISHHATIPLRSGNELFGILNVASPGKTNFTEEELALLQSIALQIGTAAHRIRLYQREQKRADLFARLGRAAIHLSSLFDSRSLASEIVKCAGHELGWPYLAVYMKENERFSRRSVYRDGTIDIQAVSLRYKRSGPVFAALTQGRTVRINELSDFLEGDLNRLTFSKGAAVPLLHQGKLFGILTACGPSKEGFDSIDAEVLESLAAHVGLTYENVWLQEQNQELARWEERNRIARDLHDSVSQMLFSISLQAKGLEAAWPDSSEQTQTVVKEIGRLSKASLTEMRTMIRQLRPAGVEEGLLTGLGHYGETIGLKVQVYADELRQLPERIEDALWRIAQEALNNISKHAQCDRASIKLSLSEWEVCMIVKDPGQGFAQSASTPSWGFGMTTMRERTEAVGGTFSVKSRVGKGTAVTVRIPL